MRIIVILLALLFGLFGIRLILTGLRTLIMIFKMENVPVKAKESLFRDFAFGILFIILAIAMLI